MADRSMIAVAEPFLAEARPTRHGHMKASERPVWHSRAVLYLTGCNRLTQRDAEGNGSVF